LRGDFIFVGSPGFKENAGKFSILSLESEDTLLELEGESNEALGSSFSVSADGSRVVMAHNGSLSLYDFDGSELLPMKAVPPVVPSVSVTAATLSPDGTQLAVSDNYDHLNKGRVTIYSLTGDESFWVEEVELVDTVNQAMFGSTTCFSEDGDRVAIAAWNRHDGSLSRAGMVRVYHKAVDGSWAPVGGDLEGDVSNLQFGRTIALSGDGQTLVVGSENSAGDGTTRGSVWVYHLADSWTQVGQTIVGDFDKDHFGRSVAVSSDGRRVAGTSYFHNAQRGQVRIFDLDDDGVAWDQVAELEGEVSKDRMGDGQQSLYLSADGSQVAIGVPQLSTSNDAALVEVGAVWVFDLDLARKHLGNHTPSPSAVPTISSTPSPTIMLPTTHAPSQNPTLPVDHSTVSSSAPSIATTLPTEHLVVSTTPYLQSTPSVTPSTEPSAHRSISPTAGPSQGFVAVGVNGSNLRGNPASGSQRDVAGTSAGLILLAIAIF